MTQTRAKEGLNNDRETGVMTVDVLTLRNIAEMDFRELRDEQDMKIREAVRDLWVNYLRSLGLRFLNSRLKIVFPVLWW